MLVLPPMTVTLEKQSDGDLRPRVMPDRHDKLTFLFNALQNYWRWRAEGQPEKPIFHLDRYHERVDYNAETGLYEFRLQTEDGPEGDTWWSGAFRIEPNGETASIEIVSEKTNFQ